MLRKKLLILITLALLTQAGFLIADPILDVSWDEEIGFPEFIDWNMAFDDVFNGGPYSISVTIRNAGDADLIIQDITCDMQEFYAEPLELTLEPDQTSEVDFIFEAINPDEYASIMQIVWNSPDGEAFGIPVIAQAFEPPGWGDPPDHIEEDMMTGEIVQRVFTIDNEGGTPLRFRIEHEMVGEPDRDFDQRSIRSSSFTSPYRDRRSNPDDMGYEWRDNLENDGPEYEWLNMNDYDNVREFRLADDQNTGSIDIGWEFPFWDRVFDQVHVDSDGWMSFSYEGNDIRVDPQEYPCRANGRQENTIAIFNTDYTQGTRVGVWSNDRDQAIIWWEGNNRHHHQMILSEDGSVVMQYGQNTQDRGCWGVGVNLGDGDHGWFISGNDRNYLTDGRTIAFGPPETWRSWLSYEPTEGIIDPGESEDIIVTIDATGLIGGDYEADLMIYTNDPANPEIVVSISVYVHYHHIIPVEWPEEFGYPDVVDFNGGFDEVFAGERYSVPVVITNVGTDPMIIEDAGSNHGYFHVDWEGIEIEIGEEFETEIIFEPEEAGEFDGIIFMAYDDGRFREYEIDVHAEALDPPQLGELPDEIEEILLSGEAEEHVIELTNEGGSPLRFQIEHEIIGEPDRDSEQRSIRSTNPKSPFRDRRGGPDEMGYEWRDNFDENRPEFEWIDLAEFEGVSHYRMGDDQTIGPFQLNWEFPYYDHSSDRIWICSDGWISPTWGGYTRRFPNYPTDQFGDMWTHSGLDWLGANHPGMFWTNDEDLAIVTYGPNYEGQGMEHQVIINRDGKIKFQYFNGWQHDNRFKAQAFVGFNAAVDGQAFGFTACPRGHGQHYLRNGLVIAFGPQDTWHSWLSYEPTEGVIEPGESEDITITIDATDLIGGLYEACLLIDTNDPGNPRLEVMIILEVHAPHWIPIEWDEQLGFPDVLDFNCAFDEMHVGERYSVPVAISNTGMDVLTVLSVNCENPYFSADWEDIEIEIGESIEAEITFEAEEAGDYDAEIVIEFDVHNLNEYEINVHAIAGEAFDPEHFIDFVETGTSHRITITNLTMEDDRVSSGWEIGIFTPDDILTGGEVWYRGGRLTLSAYGDDPETDEVEGFDEGEYIRIRAWDRESGREYQARPEVEDGELLWEDGGETILSLEVADDLYGFLLDEGWNLMSIDIYPDERYYGEDEERGPDIVLMFDAAMPDYIGTLILVKTEDGLFWAPAWAMCILPFWDLTEGYMMDLGEARELFWYGELIPPDTEIPIEEGWNYIAYFPEYQLPCNVPDFYAFESILEELVIAKDYEGRFCVPQFEFSNLPPLRAGKGYQVRVSEEVVLTYPPEPEEEELASHKPTQHGLIHFDRVEVTGSNMSLLLRGEILQTGSEIGVYSKAGRLVGSSAITENGICGLAVWGDDQSTEIIDGLSDKESLELRLWNSADNSEIVIVDKSDTNPVYLTDNFIVLDVSEKLEIPEKYCLSEAFPNPFNSRVQLNYELPEASMVSIRVFDTSGRLVATLADGDVEAGTHSVMWNGKDNPSGIYLIRVNMGGVNITKKVALIR